MTYSVVLSDNPWKYRNFSEVKHGAASAQYETMETADICAIPVQDWAAEDSILLSWGTWPKMPDALQVMSAWGFDYVTGVPWIKTLPKQQDLSTGVGFWFQSCSEYLLVGKRGNPTLKKFPILGLLTGEPRQFYAPRSRHSAKPIGIHEWIEQRVPNATYLEMFARSERAGWRCCGLETGWRLSARGCERVEEVK